MAIAVASGSTLNSKEKSAAKGLFERMFARFIEARQLQAQRYVNGYLLTFNDQTLAELGYERSELKKNAVDYFPY